MFKEIGFLFRNREGFTLIEVLATLAIMSFCALLLFSVYVPSAKWINRAGKDTIAINYAAAISEDLRAHSENLYQVINTTPDDGNLGLNHSYQPEGFTATVDMVPFSAGLAANLYCVTVNVNWVADKTNKKVTLSTLIRKDDS